MRDLTWARALAHPGALAVSPTEDTSFPLARRIGAVWVGHTHSQWIALYTRFVLASKALTPDEKARLLAYHRSDLEAVLREIRDKRPEIIIEEMRPIFSWLVPELNALQPGFLDDYTVIVEENGIRVLRMKSMAGPDSAAPRPLRGEESWTLTEQKRGLWAWISWNPELPRTARPFEAAEKHSPFGPD